eukprot:121610-Chlamydomonas_euryale.AAC.1
MPAEATVELIAGDNRFVCSDPVVTAVVLGSLDYTETIVCNLPDNLPAADYMLAISTNVSAPLDARMLCA